MEWLAVAGEIAVVGTLGNSSKSSKSGKNHIRTIYLGQATVLHQAKNRQGFLPIRLLYCDQLPLEAAKLLQPTPQGRRPFGGSRLTG